MSKKYLFIMSIVFFSFSGCTFWENKIDTVVESIEDGAANGILKGKEIKDSLLQEGQEIQEEIQNKITQFDTALAEVHQARRAFHALFGNETLPDFFSCEQDTDCILVPHKGCCSDVLPIRVDKKEEYIAHKEWQTDPRSCAAISCAASLVHAPKKAVCLSSVDEGEKTCVAVLISSP